MATLVAEDLHIADEAIRLIESLKEVAGNGRFFASTSPKCFRIAPCTPKSTSTSVAIRARRW